MAWGAKSDQFNIKKNENVYVPIGMKSWEYNGCWYTGVKAWTVSRLSDHADNFYWSDSHDCINNLTSSIPDFDDGVIRS